MRSERSVLWAHEVRIGGHHRFSYLFRAHEDRIISKQMCETQLVAAMLPGSCQVAAAPYFHVLFGDDEAIVRLRQHVQSSGVVGIWSNQNAKGLRGTPPNAAAQLMQLRKAEGLRVQDEHHRRVWDVNPNFNHRRRNQDFNETVSEKLHDLVLLRDGHATMEQGHLYAGESGFAQLFCLLLRRVEGSLGFVNGWTDHKCLMTLFHLASHEREDFFFCFLAANESLNRSPPGRHLIDRRDVEIRVHRLRQRAGMGVAVITSV